MTVNDLSLSILQVAAAAADAKQAHDIVALDVSEALGITDAFLVASASNERLVNAVVDEIEEKLVERLELRPDRFEHLVCLPGDAVEVLLIGLFIDRLLAGIAPLGLSGIASAGEGRVEERFDRLAGHAAKQVRLQGGERVDLGLRHAHGLLPPISAALGCLQRG